MTEAHEYACPGCGTGCYGSYGNPCGRCQYEARQRVRFALTTPRLRVSQLPGKGIGSPDQRESLRSAETLFEVEAGS